MEHKKTAKHPRKVKHVSMAKENGKAMIMKNGTDKATVRNSFPTKTTGSSKGIR